MPGTVCSSDVRARPLIGNVSMRARSSVCPSVGLSVFNSGVTSCTEISVVVCPTFSTTSTTAFCCTCTVRAPSNFCIPEASTTSR
jgi:hypothetical protein